LVRSPGFEPGSSAWEDDPHENRSQLANGGSVSIDWEAFEKWLLKDHRPHTTVSMVSYAKQFQDCLVQMDLSRVQDLRDSFRPNVLKALSALAKFTGVYEQYRKAMRGYGLKWGGRNADDIVIDRFTKVKDSGEVWSWIREVKRARPELTDFMDLMALTGLRLGEAIDSYNLIIDLAGKGKLTDYYKKDQGILEHFRYKDLFIRKSKKAFISFVPEELIQRIREDRPLKSKFGIQKRVSSQKLKLRFGDLREAHASFMTKHLQQSEIDFIHGRVSTNVFMRNYFNPALIGDLKARALKGIQEIQEKIR